MPLISFSFSFRRPFSSLIDTWMRLALRKHLKWTTWQSSSAVDRMSTCEPLCKPPETPCTTLSTNPLQNQPSQTKLPTSPNVSTCSESTQYKRRIWTILSGSPDAERHSKCTTVWTRKRWVAFSGQNLNFERTKIDSPPLNWSEQRNGRIVELCRAACRSACRSAELKLEKIKIEIRMH